MPESVDGESKDENSHPPEYWEDVEFFIEDTNEYLTELGKELVSIEHNHNEKTLNKMYRALHSIKGCAGSLELHKIVAISHFAEDLFDLIRKFPEGIEQKQITLLLSVCDAIANMVVSLEENKNEGLTTS